MTVATKPQSRIFHLHHGPHSSVYGEISVRPCGRLHPPQPHRSLVLWFSSVGLLSSRPPRHSSVAVSPNKNLPAWRDVMDASASRCANVQITSKQDFDGLNECGTVARDVPIGRGSAGQGTLNRVYGITGSLRLAPCPSTACNGLMRTSSPDLLEVGEQIIFEGLTSLTEILFPKVQSAHSISLAWAI